MRTASSLLLAAFACRAPTKDTDTIAREDGGGDSSGGGDTDDDEPAKAPGPVERRASNKPPTAIHRVPLIETVRSDPRSVPEDGLRG